MKTSLAVCAGLALVFGCAREAPPVVTAPPAPEAPPPATESVTTAPTTSAPVTPPAPAASTSAAVRPASAPACPDTFPPMELLRDNMKATSMTGLAEIVASRVTGLDGSTPAPTTGYVSLKYEVEVLEWFAGSGPTRLTLTQGAEAGASPRGPGELLLFSACASGPGLGHEPDVGYFFAIDPACRAEATSRAAKAAKRAGVSPKTPPRKKPSACQS